MIKCILFLAFLFIGVSRASDSWINLYLLADPGKVPAKSRFWIEWNNDWKDVTKSKKIVGNSAKEIVALLNESLLPQEAQDFCGHDPIYGIEIIRMGQLPFRTSLCFTCLTWMQHGKRLEIKGPPGITNPLCERLRKEIELPKSLLKGK